MTDSTREPPTTRPTLERKKSSKKKSKKKSKHNEKHGKHDKETDPNKSDNIRGPPRLSTEKEPLSNHPHSKIKKEEDPADDGISSSSKHSPRSKTSDQRSKKLKKTKSSTDLDKKRIKRSSSSSSRSSTSSPSRRRPPTTRTPSDPAAATPQAIIRSSSAAAAAPWNNGENRDGLNNTESQLASSPETSPFRLPERRETPQRADAGNRLRQSTPGAFPQPGSGNTGDTDGSENDEPNHRDTFRDEEEESPEEFDAENELIAATLVEQESNRMANSANRERVPPTLNATLLYGDEDNEVDNEEDNGRENKRLAMNQRWMCILLFLLCCAVAVTILVVVLGQSGDGGAVAQETGPQPTVAPVSVESGPTAPPTESQSPTSPPTTSKSPSASPTEAFTPSSPLDFPNGFACGVSSLPFSINQHNQNVPNGAVGSGLLALDNTLQHCALRLTGDQLNVAASAFGALDYKGHAFAVKVTYRIFGGNLEGADGMVFVMHQDPRGDEALGAAGGGLGYFAGVDETQIENSLGVFMASYGRPRVGVVQSGVILGEGHSPQVNTRSSFQQLGYLWVHYCPATGEMRAYQNVLGEVPLLRASAQVQPAEVLDFDRPVYVGMTAATGDLSDNHDIHSFTMKIGEGCDTPIGNNDGA